MSLARVSTPGAYITPTLSRRPRRLNPRALFNRHFATANSTPLGSGVETPA